MIFLRNTKGAVSIFLIIILLPCITIAGLFLDVSRVMLSQEVVTSSADLALNTTLSNYDKNLKDYFGLLASCQDTDEVISLSKQYFAESMVSAGVTTSDAEAYADEILSVFTGDDDIRDMLQIAVDGEVRITGVENGAMDNPALLKEGIVEFMKYRAPVNGIADLFNNISSSGVSDQLENSSKEAAMVEKKKAFYEAEEKLIEQAETAYNAIKKYESYKTWTGSKFTDETFLDSMSSFLKSPDGSGNNFETIFRDAHEKMVMNLFNTHDTDGMLSVSLIANKNITSPMAVTTYSDSKRAPSASIETLLKNFNTALLNYDKAQSSLKTAWNSVGQMTSDDYSIQYWVVLTKACSEPYSDYVIKASALWQAALKLENAVLYAADNAMDERMKLSDVRNDKAIFDMPDSDGKLSLQSIYDSLESYYSSEFEMDINRGGCTSFKNISSQINSLESARGDKLDLSTVAEIYNIRNKIYNYQKDFDSAYDLAKTAKTETNKLKNLLKKYKEAFEAWKTAAYDSELDDSDLAASDRQEIQKLEETGIEFFSENSVTDLTDRLNNIMTLCMTFRDDLKAIKYNNTAVINISGYGKFRTAANLDESKIVRNESVLRQYVADSFSFSIGTQIQNIEIYDNRTSTSLGDGDAYVITDSFHPNIQKTSLELYEWMKQKFDTPASGSSITAANTGFDVNDKNSAKSAKSDISDRSEDTSSADSSENETGHEFSEWSGAELPSKGENAAQKQSVTAKLTEIGNFASSIFSDFNGTFMDSLVNMRDDLYMVDYVFGMFTYDTFNNEGYYSQLKPEEQNSLKASQAQSKYTTEVKEAWVGSNEYKTLTLTPRDSSNNWAYGGEVEYILYGNDTNASNITTAYAQIYMIRYALDLSAVFNTYWDDEILMNVANALEVFAFIPASLTKTLACLAITAAEAAIDIYTLKQGIPVVLIKTSDNLVCNYRSVFMGESERENTSDDSLKLQYSDYLKIFLFIKLLGNNENVIYTRTADVIQANMSLSTNNNEYGLSKAQVCFDFSATVIIEPMWSKLLAIDNLGDLSTSKNWRTITIHMTRGY